MKTAHMFHHNDWDGKMSAAVMYQYFREARPDVEDYRFYEVDYTLDLGNDVRADFNPGDVIVFTDYSFSKESNVTWLLGLITHNNYEILWIDHHKSSVELCNKPVSIYGVEYSCMDNLDADYNIKVVVDSSYCATWLAWAYCYSLIKHIIPGVNTTPNLIKYVNSHDTFKHDMPNTEECHYGFMGYRYTPKTIFKKIFNGKSALSIFSNDKESLDAMDKFINKMISSGTAIKKYVDHRNEIERDFAGFRFTITDRVRCRVYSCYAMNIHSNSQAFGPLYDMYDIVCPFIFVGGKQWKYSLFSSKKDIDCSVIAKALGAIDNLGGGGHPGAAGFQTYDCILSEGCDVIIDGSFFRKKTRAYIVEKGEAL